MLLYYMGYQWWWYTTTHRISRLGYQWWWYHHSQHQRLTRPKILTYQGMDWILRENVHSTLNIITVLRNTPYCSQTPNSMKEDETSKALPTVPTIQGIKEWCPQMAHWMITCWKVQTLCIHFTWSSISYHGTKAIPHPARICTMHFWSS